ncbi:sigma-70 family RNA polymerase sigma factor [Methylobacterium nodulans]|uniref:RNA polymerase, sigma-24 subunit, ECF subfamily n=1 Tax=Methylobacterium nodulans (strain LMG 21967 / CNCM I-2342 / ORS 2060) TaxID=460265 RepID=B8IQB1_METNO|nr:sigma-70 family RNA polymerase sigma factor [Methylobacterium nodulans]ACL58611.1 RNA polymerase, sigma-24 subunit, ECF subfamily [Methylobacterium nodulans ORS 2060]
MPPDAATRVFEAQRLRLVRLAYRMLGSVAEAEDAVQDAWLRWRRVEAEVDEPAAYLTRIVTRLCLDRMKSARARRETYVGAWLPEPLMGTTPEEPEDDLTLTLMLALERLSPLERAAFLLHDVFGVPLNEVAGTLGREAAAVRQLAVRARRHVQAARPRYTVERAEAERIATAFFAASRDGDTQALGRMLAADVVLHSDGGGRVIAFRNPIVGIARVLRLYAGLQRKHGPAVPQLLRPIWIDGLPGYVSIDRGAILQTTALAIEDGRIAAIYIVRNPDKLRHVGRILADG